MSLQYRLLIFIIRSQSFQCDQASEPPRQTRSRIETAQPSTIDN